MYQSVNSWDFSEAFRQAGREDNFSRDGLEKLFEYLEEYEEETGEQIELDVVAICCEYSEYENIEELKNSYPDIESIEELENNTLVIKIDDESFIIQDF